MDDDDDLESYPDSIPKAEPLEHIGFDSQRVVFAQEGMARLEQVLAFRWLELNKGEWCILDRLLCSPPETNTGATQRDATVAATVIPWLGTAVGYAFLERCLKEAGFKIEPPR
jgi:hypothetical protein